jgi:hypothetical protein
MSAEKIPGIHNYCDRWCERCSLSSRCALFAEESETKEADNKESGNQAFWERLTINFTKAQDMLVQAAERQGIDLNEIAKSMEAVKAQETFVREKSLDHPLTKLSLAYEESAKAWLREQPGMISKLEELKNQLTQAELTLVAKNTLDVIQDCLAVIEWYESFISVKITRALMGRMDVDPDNTSFINDSDGSAKVALLGIDRSIRAWEKLFNILPEQEDEFLTVLGMLTKLKKSTLAEFPAAMDFKRPGFD